MRDFERDFSKKVITALDKKGVKVTGIQAVPAFDGDKYFSGTAYQLSFGDKYFLRLHSQVLCIAASSWDPTVEGAI